MSKRIIIFILLLTFVWGENAPINATESALNLEQAIEKTLQENLDLIPFKWELKARESETKQLSLFPNPEFELEIENILGTNEASGFKIAEYNFLVSQEIPLAGKRKKATHVANLEKSLVNRDYDIKATQLITDTKKRFMDVLHLQEKIKLRKEMVTLSQQLMDKIKIRIQAGKDSPIELTRAQVSHSRLMMEIAQLQRELSLAKLRLAAMWSSIEPDFDSVTGQLKPRSPLLPFNRLTGLLKQNNQLNRLDTEIEINRSLVTLERASKIPNPAVTGGIKRINEARSTAFTIGVGMEIPVFNRNNHVIEAARFRVKKSRAEWAAHKKDLTAQLKELHQSIQLTLNNATQLQDSLLPKVVATGTAILNAYAQGKYTVLDVLEAHKTELEIKEEYIDTLAQYWQFMAEMEALTGIKIKQSHFPVNKELAF
jgi:cobalt-zinc-cadmium efflux system outer membrane protein